MPKLPATSTPSTPTASLCAITDIFTFSVQLTKRQRKCICLQRLNVIMLHACLPSPTLLGASTQKFTLSALLITDMILWQLVIWTGVLFISFWMEGFKVILRPEIPTVFKVFPKKKVVIPHRVTLGEFFTPPSVRLPPVFPLHPVCCHASSLLIKYANETQMKHLSPCSLRAWIPPHPNTNHLWM